MYPIQGLHHSLTCVFKKINCCSTIINSNKMHFSHYLHYLQWQEQVQQEEIDSLQWHTKSPLWREVSLSLCATEKQTRESRSCYYYTIKGRGRLSLQDNEYLNNVLCLFEKLKVPVEILDSDFEIGLSHIMRNSKDYSFLCLWWEKEFKKLTSLRNGEAQLTQIHVLQREQEMNLE